MKKLIITLLFISVACNITFGIVIYKNYNASKNYIANQIDKYMIDDKEVSNPNNFSVFRKKTALKIGRALLEEQTLMYTKDDSSCYRVDDNGDYWTVTYWPDGFDSKSEYFIDPYIISFRKDNCSVIDGSEID